MTTTFTPGILLKNAHIQTMLPAYLKKQQHIDTIEEIVQLPDDDFVELAWTEKPTQDNQKPIVILLHGLEGSINSHYIKGFLAALKTHHYIGVLMHFRNCGQYRNRKPASYHSGATDDFRFVLHLLHERYQQRSFLSIGFSLGGNVLTKYLGEEADQALLDAAAVISAPLDLAACSQKLNTGFSRIYQHYLLKSLKKQAVHKITSRQIIHLSTTELENIQTIWAFDEKITAPLNHFKNAADYYHQCSGKNFIPSITVPTLFIQALDDPFLSTPQFSPQVMNAHHLTIETTQHGGHIGFLSGYNPLNPTFWLEQRVLRYLKKQL